jgi:hypothetical protein
MLKASEGSENTIVPKGESATFVVKKADYPTTKREKAWRLAKRIETGRTYLIVSAESASNDQAFALTNRTKPATTATNDPPAVPESLSRSLVTISGDTILPLGHVSDPNGLAQDNLKFFFQETPSPRSGQYANQLGYTIECFIHGTNVYPMIVFRGNGATNTVVNGQYSLITRQTNGSEGPQIADRALDQAVWFNTGINPVTGETRMFLFSGSNSKYYVLKEVENGNTPARDTGNAISQRQASRGGFVALESDSPDAGTKVKLYVYDIDPYDTQVDDEIMKLFKPGKFPKNAEVTEKGFKYTEPFEGTNTILSNSMLDGWTIVGATPHSGSGWQAGYEVGRLYIKFTDDVYDEVITVTLEKDGVTKEIEIEFSGYKEFLWKKIIDKAGCNVGVAFLALLVFCPLFLRRK